MNAAQEAGAIPHTGHGGHPELSARPVHCEEGPSRCGRAPCHHPGLRQRPHGRQFSRAHCSTGLSPSSGFASKHACREPSVGIVQGPTTFPGQATKGDSRREAKRPKPCPLSPQQQEWSRPPVTLHLPDPSSVASFVFLFLNQECLVFLSRLAILSCGPLLLITLSCPHPPPLRTSGRKTCSICGEPDATEPVGKDRCSEL